MQSNVLNDLAKAKRRWTEKKVQEEIDKGWVFEYPGTLEKAQAEYTTGVAIGKLGIAHADGRAPRLVVDSTVCGLNGRCIIPERSTLPTAKEILRSYPFRQCRAPLQGFSVDVKAAHKRIVLHPSEQGLGVLTGWQIVLLPRNTVWCSVFSFLVGTTGRLDFMDVSSFDLAESCRLSVRG